MARALGMRSGLIWQMVLHRRPDLVFALLADTARRHSRLLRADAVAGWLDVTGPGHDGRRGAPLRLTLRAHGTGTLLRIAEVTPGEARQTSERLAAQASSISSLVRQIRESCSRSD